ncbi:hypothetical protein Tco_1343010 [Tanacetum coccineum]
MDTKVVGGSEVRAEGSETIAQESSLKRAGDELEQENAKKQKVDAEKETKQEKVELQSLMEIVSDEEGMLKDFDKEDLETLWRLVKAKHGYTRPEEGYKRVLWGDLKTMFEHHIEDTVWRNLQENNVLV